MPPMGRAPFPGGRGGRVMRPPPSRGGYYGQYGCESEVGSRVTRFRVVCKCVMCALSVTLTVPCQCVCVHKYIQ